MKTIRISLLVSLLSAGLIACAQVPPSPTVGKWDFAYQITGGSKVVPVQVFDDGEGKTYFQFREGQVIPSIIGASGKILIPQRVGPYMVVEGAERDYTLSIGLARARVTHTSVASGVVKTDEVPESLQPSTVGASSAATGSATELVPPPGIVQPRKSYRVRGPEAKGDWTQNTYATPLRGDATLFVKDEKPQVQPKRRKPVKERKQVALPASGAYGTGTASASSPCPCDSKK